MISFRICLSRGFLPRGFLAGSVLALVALCSTTQVAWSQPKPPPPVPPNPQAPVLALPFPQGLQRGTSLDLTLTGTNLAGPTGLWTAFPGKNEIPTADKNGADQAKLLVKLNVPADAPIGYHGLRLATGRGMSNLRLFCIDDLPQVPEKDGNISRETAMPLPIPCVLAGKLDAEKSDFFKITVAAGQRLSFDLLGRRLGSPIDPHLAISSVKTGREIIHDNDAPGCQGDPRISFTFKEAGDYILEVRDVLFRGGADYAYRLRIGDFPLATACLPMAAKRGSQVKVAFAGSYVDGVQPVDVKVPADPSAQVVWVAPKGPTGQHGWPVALLVTDKDEGMEQEPNNEPAKAQPLSVPGAVTGRFLQSDDIDLYKISTKKGQKLVIDVSTIELNSPTLVYFLVKNAKTGAELAKSNPQAAPPADQRLEFTAPEDADYLIEVQHLNYGAGPGETYRLVVAPSAPAFDIALGIERFDASVGAFVPLPVQVNRRGYTGPIQVTAVGDPNLSGTATIKAGQAGGVLLLSVKPEATLGPKTFIVQAKATIDGKEVTQQLNGRVPVSTSLAGLAHPPIQSGYEFAVALKEKAPFSVAVKMEPAETVPGINPTVVLTVKREAGFEEEISFNPPIGLPPNAAPPKLGNIPKGQTELKFPLDVNAKVPLGEYPVLFGAKAKTKDKGEVTASSPPLNVVVAAPFDLKIEPPTLTLKPGDKGKVKVTATRRGGYKGPITLEVRKLQANVTAGKATINPDQSMVEVEVIAAAAAAPGDKTDVDVLGTAAALNNLQNASPAFTVRVEKK